LHFFHTTLLDGESVKSLSLANTHVQQQTNYRKDGVMATHC
jgi:hypothetical protein